MNSAYREILLASWIWMFISLSRFPKFSVIFALYILSLPFLFSSLFEVLILQMFCFIVPHNSYSCLQSFLLFFLFLSCLSNFQCPVSLVHGLFLCIVSQSALSLSIKCVRSVIVFVFSRISVSFFNGCSFFIFFIKHLILLLMRWFPNSVEFSFCVFL